MAEHTDVFISSTSIDLPAYRQAVRDAIEELSMFPSGMERWPVSGRDAVDLCRKMVADAEVFVGIYAYRCGWLPDGPGGVSITEMEYDWAENIPRFCFIMDDAHPYPSDDDHRDKDPDRIARLDAFKDRVRARHVGFFTTEDNLKAQVLAALAQYRLLQTYRPLKTYLRWLHHTSLESGLLRALDPRRNDPTASGKIITVDQVYTPLDVKHPVYRADDGRILPADAATEVLGRHTDGEREATPLTAMEAASLNDRLVLLGDPGSGKSTFASFLALCLSGHALDPSRGWLDQLEAQGWAQGARLPLLIVLRELAETLSSGEKTGSAGHIWSFLDAELGRRGGEAALPAVRQAFDRGEALLIFDGLDEVPAEKRGLIRDAVVDFIRTLDRDNRVLVTCRILSYTDPRYKIPGLTEETVAPFDDPKIEHFTGAWYAALHHLGRIDADLMRARIDDLNQAIQDAHIRPIAGNPMLLTVMVLVHNHTGTLPRETARLYERCVDLLLLRWRPDEAKALIDELDIKEGDLKRILWALAYAAHDEQGGGDGAADIPQSMILSIAGQYLRDDDDQTGARLFCNYVERRAGLLIARGTDKYGQWMFAFPHRTFQEYLAGCYLAGDRFYRRAEEHARKGAHWRVALLLATGHLRFNDDKTDIPLDAIDRMCPADASPQTADDWRVIALAGEMLLLVGTEDAERDLTGSKVLGHVRSQLARLLEGGGLPPVERAAAGRTLGLLGDPRPGVGVVAFTPLSAQRSREGPGVRAIPDLAWSDEIPAGTYTIGGDKQAYNSFPRMDIPIAQPYRIARYLITYEQFQTFVDDPNGLANPRWWKDLAANESHKRLAAQYFPYPNHPRDSVNWYQAVAFCRWLTARYHEAALFPSPSAEAALFPPLGEESGVRAYEIRLPHEYEWEVAARGADGRIYSYPGAFDPAKANTHETGIGMTSAVGLFPDGVSPSGALDMTGSVWEWCANTYTEPDKDDLTGTDVRVLRGGSWSYYRHSARAASRIGSDPVDRNGGVGFRVVLARLLCL